jgi:multidrug efflux pump subunit AcrA (membrane-fusion protein)
MTGRDGPRWLPAEAPLATFVVIVAAIVLIRGSWLVLAIGAPLCLLGVLQLVRRTYVVWKARRWAKASDRVRRQLLHGLDHASVAPIVTPPPDRADRTGIVILWRKAPGEAVTEAEAIVDVSFGSRNGVTIRSPNSGRLLAISKYPYDKVSGGTVLGEILVAGPSETAAASTDAETR